MVSMTVSLPEHLRDFVRHRLAGGNYSSESDYIRDLIRRDQGDIQDVDRWLRELDASVARGIADAGAGRVHDLDQACDAIIGRIEARAARR